MTVILIVTAFVALDLGLVIWALMRLSAHRQAEDITDMRQRHPRQGRFWRG